MVTQRKTNSEKEDKGENEEASSEKCYVPDDVRAMI